MFISEEDSSEFVSKVGDSSGGQYSINMKLAFIQLTWATIENIVMERFGSKAARIFRYVLFERIIILVTSFYVCVNEFCFFLG
jgi:DNA-directed RNA polymerase III subunit RPC3